MKFFQRFRPERPDTTSSLAAKIEASLRHRVAVDRDKEVEQQAQELERVNAENHFTQKLRLSFGAGQ